MAAKGRAGEWDRLERFTAQTIVSRAKLLDELAHVRETGVAFDREEHTEGICAVGAAVGGKDDLLVAISVPVPAPRFYGREKELAVAVSAAVNATSKALA